jgi:hypothetical protein
MVCSQKPLARWEMVPRVRWMTVVDPRPGHSSRDAWVRRFYEFRGGQMRDGLLAPEGAAKSRWRFSTSIISLKGKAVWPEAAQRWLLMISFPHSSLPHPHHHLLPKSRPLVRSTTCSLRTLYTLLKSTRAALPCHSSSVRPIHSRRPHSLSSLYFFWCSCFLSHPARNSKLLFFPHQLSGKALFFSRHPLATWFG